MPRQEIVVSLILIGSIFVLMNWQWIVAGAVIVAVARSVYGQREPRSRYADADIGSDE